MSSGQKVRFALYGLVLIALYVRAANMEADNASLLTLTPVMIQGVIMSQEAPIKHCYQTELKSKPTLAGRVTLVFTIDEHGEVSETQAQHEAPELNQLALCIEGLSRGWRFPSTPKDGSAVVKFPFDFAPEGQKRDKSQDQETQAQETQAQDAQAQDATQE